MATPLGGDVHLIWSSARCKARRRHHGFWTIDGVEGRASQDFVEPLSSNLVVFSDCARTVAPDPRRNRRRSARNRLSPLAERELAPEHGWPPWCRMLERPWPDRRAT